MLDKILKAPLEQIAKGCNSIVYKCKVNGIRIVLKTVSTTCRKEAKHLFNEYEIMKELKHSNVVEMFGFQNSIELSGSENKFGKKNLLILENACHGNLSNFYRTFKPKIFEIRWIFSEIAAGLYYLHDRKVVHRDLKFDNILVCEYSSEIEIKLSDFGFAEKTEDKEPISNSITGTRIGYMAPEILHLEKEHNKYYDMYKADIFALGIILFNLVIGKLPWIEAIPEDRNWKLIANESFEVFWKSHEKRLIELEEEDGQFVEDFKRLFEKMVQINSEKRPTIKEIIHEEWLKGKQEVMKAIKKKKLKLK